MCMVPTFMSISAVAIDSSVSEVLRLANARELIDGWQTHVLFGPWRILTLVGKVLSTAHLVAREILLLVVVIPIGHGTREVC